MLDSASSKRSWARGVPVAAAAAEGVSTASGVRRADMTMIGMNGAGLTPRNSGASYYGLQLQC